MLRDGFLSLVCPSRSFNKSSLVFFLALVIAWMQQFAGKSFFSSDLCVVGFKSCEIEKRLNILNRKERNEIGNVNYQESFLILFYPTNETKTSCGVFCCYVSTLNIVLQWTKNETKKINVCIYFYIVIEIIALKIEVKSNEYFP